jgi:hypothetical protein
MNPVAPIIGIVVVTGILILFFWPELGIFHYEQKIEDNVTLLHCTGDRFAFIQGTYLYPVTEEEIAAGRDEVIRRVMASGGPSPRMGSSGGGGPGEPHIIAWGYCIDETGVPRGFTGIMGADAPSREALEESNRWYRDTIVNRSLDANASCTSQVVTERFVNTGQRLIRVV